MLELLLMRGGKHLLRRPVGGEPLTIGRAPDNAIVLLDDVISRHHCRLEPAGAALRLVDRSTNGTLVNGTLLSDATVTAGDRISLGPWTIVVEEAVGADSRKTVAAAPSATKAIGYDAKQKLVTTETIEFIITSPEQQPLRRCMSAPEITIGTHGSCELAVADPFVSRRHCRILHRDGKLILLDLASTNGTVFDGARVDRIALPESGAFTIGRSSVAWRKIIDRERLVPRRAFAFGSMIGPSQAMRELFSLVERVAPSDAPVCIAGESGTGKELVARELHARSPRRRAPFVAVNCGALPASLIEGQLFGHERGAFTGALERMAGLFEQARGGTLFLDEIGEMPQELQTRLLRVLENRTVRRIGGQEEIAVDARIICATNRDLKAQVAAGRFREDLFFRIYVVPLLLPPLRERPEDIRALALHFLQEAKEQKAPPTITPAAMEKLVSHPWPGNVRELRNTIARSLLLAATPKLDAGDILIDAVADDGTTGEFREREREILAAALAACGNNISRTARRLGIARTTLQKKIRRFALTPPGGA